MVPTDADGRVRGVPREDRGRAAHQPHQRRRLRDRARGGRGDPAPAAPCRSSARSSRRSSATGCYGYAAEGYWIDIGTPERYLEATWDLLAGRVALEAAAARRDRLARSTRAACCRARTSGPQSVLGRHCSVGSDSRVERSVLHDRVIGGRRRRGASRACSPSACAWGSGARVEPGAMVGAGAVIGEGAVIGAGARLDPGVEVEAGARGRRATPSRRAERRARSRPSTRRACSATSSPSRSSSATRSGAPSRPASRSSDRPGGLVVCGMGGSAIGGDLAAAALGDRATRPITTVRGYALESWTRPGQPRAVRELLGQHRGDARLLRGRRRGRRRPRGAHHRRPAGRAGARRGRAGDRRARRACSRARRCST